MKDTLPDIYGLIQHILDDGRYAGSTVIADLDAHSYEGQPLVTWMFINEGQIDYGLWAGTLTLNVMCPVDQYVAVTAHVYKQVHSWNKPEVGVLNKFGVQEVTDRGAFNPVNQAQIHGKHVLQFEAQFHLTLHDWS